MNTVRMLVIAVAACLLLAAATDAAKETKEMYTSKFDNLDVDAILRSERLLKNYHKCLMEKGPCTAEGAELRKNLPEAMANDCAKCNPRQKSNSDKVMRHLISNKPEMWSELEKKYDPTGGYRRRSGL